jgi:ABC-2 type transport system ATP-binding protein
VIAARGLRKGFGPPAKRVEAVLGIDLDVHRGEIFGFLGPNGAGKTTTLRMLTTLLPIDDGTAVVAGCDVGKAPGEVRRRIGYVSQLGGTDPFATGRENVALQARLYGASKEAAVSRASELLDLLDLTNIADRKVQTYSGGQRRRLDVALGIAHRPEVLFLDEPSTGLDPQNRAHLWDHVGALRDEGTTVFLTTHYLEEADALCDRLMIVDHGQVVADGTARDLKLEVAGDRVVLALRDDAHSARALATVEGADFVRSATAEAESLRLYVDDGARALPELIRLLDAAQLQVTSVSMSEPTLDDVFMAKTGRSLRDAGDAGGGHRAGRNAA